MRKLFPFFIAAFLFYVPFSNGEPLTINRFLGTAENDHQLQSHRELVEHIRTSPESTPYVDRIEFRTETEEFDIEKQKYSLRFHPRGWGETKCSKKIFQTTGKAVKAEHDALFNNVLKNRYELVLDFLETLSLLNMKKNLLIVYDDEVNVLRKMSTRDLSFDIRTLVSAEDRYVDLQLDLVKLENKLTGIIEEIKTIAGYYEEISFDEKNLIGPERIEEMIRYIQPVPAPDNVRIRYQKLKTELAENRYQFEIAKNRKYFNFLKLQYDTDDYDEPEKAFSVEVGFNLPFVNPDREDINRRKRNWLDEKLEYEEEKNKASEKIRSLSASLNRLIRQHRILVNRKPESNAEISFKKYMEMEGINPLTLLKIKKSILESEMRLKRIGYLIRRQYIDLMNITGKLSEKPLKNYLSARAEDIK
ncbi:hypothetical protein [Desulfonema magnum]|uniref:Uncharacterized protein n=1 Tax=Desulfonema magnum TaxID=45655 RepID=A0A975BHS0_9BACT|nr:hypothetical protein [Desulfonema magnum]QTA85652.1 Uncharacterized protein dnm_016650 [Desulfonema magnum]